MTRSGYGCGCAYGLALGCCRAFENLRARRCELTLPARSRPLDEARRTAGTEPRLPHAARRTKFSISSAALCLMVARINLFGVPIFASFLYVNLKGSSCNARIQGRINSVRICISMVFAALCAGGSAFIYEADVNPGHGPMSPWYMAGIAAFAASVWALSVFPRMGKGWVTDVLWIVAAYPCVGAIAGFFIAFGHPIGILSGAYIAIVLPLLFQPMICTFYISGAALAFILPRIPRNA